MPKFSVKKPLTVFVAVAAVSMEGKDTIALTEFLNGTLMNQMEGVAGVAPDYHHRRH